MAGLLFAFGFHRWRSPQAVTPLQSPLPQDPYIQVYFNHSQASVYTDSYRHIQRHGDDLEQTIIDAINQAQSQIDVAVQEINLPNIALALKAKAESGVTIRIILENQYNRVWQPLDSSRFSQLEERDRGRHSERQQLIDTDHNGKITATELDNGDAIRILQQSGIPIVDDTADGSKGSGLMHHKFMVIDQQIVLTGSNNWTLSGSHGDFAEPESRGNANALMVLKSPQVATAFTDEFELMWGDGPGQKPDSRFGLQKPPRSPQALSLGSAQVTLQFSPLSETQPWQHSTNGLISKTLAQASQSIDLALFVFSDQGIANSLAPVVQAGVTLSALVDSGFIYRSYSEALDLLGVATPDHRCRFEANNYPWPQGISTVGTPTLAPGDKLHHKFALVDNLTVIIGSHNWSAAANHNNDENLLIIRNPTVAAHFRREIERLKADAAMGLTTDLQKHLQRQRKVCGL
jgi:phosphatidylserine/phosphatidylglycerophosphate/cardiolipin synthase-like enzyme